MGALPGCCGTFAAGLDVSVCSAFGWNEENSSQGSPTQQSSLWGNLGWEVTPKPPNAVGKRPRSPKSSREGSRAQGCPPHIPSRGWLLPQHAGVGRQVRSNLPHGSSPHPFPCQACTYRRCCVPTRLCMECGWHLPHRLGWPWLLLLRWSGRWGSLGPTPGLRLCRAPRLGSLPCCRLLPASWLLPCLLLPACRLLRVCDRLWLRRWGGRPMWLGGLLRFGGLGAMVVCSGAGWRGVLSRAWAVGCRHAGFRLLRLLGGG